MELLIIGALLLLGSAYFLVAHKSVGACLVLSFLGLFFLSGGLTVYYLDSLALPETNTTVAYAPGYYEFTADNASCQNCTGYVDCCIEKHDYNKTIVGERYELVERMELPSNGTRAAYYSIFQYFIVVAFFALVWWSIRHFSTESYKRAKGG